MKKNYGVFVSGEKLTLTYRSRAVLEDIYCLASVTRERNIPFVADGITETEDGYLIDFRRRVKKDWLEELESLRLRLTERGQVLQLSVEAKVNTEPVYRSYTFPAEELLWIKFRFASPVDDMLYHDYSNVYWMSNRFKADYDAFDRNQLSHCAESFYMEDASFRQGDIHFHLLPLVCESFSARMVQHEGIVLQNGCAGRTELNGAIFTLSAADEPEKAIHQNFIAAKETGAIHVDLRGERSYPDCFKGFGWCTWNAFYREVTSEKIYEKLEEFKAKGISLRWLLIDDGWSEVNAEKRTLLSFREDRAKFPEGLKVCIDKIKREYGVKYVGVWHAYSGYWMGIDPESEIVRTMPQAVHRIPFGTYYPAFDAEGAFLFWDSWHGYLQEQGVDFVKIDNQTAFNTKFDNIMGSSEGIYIQNSAMEKSVFRHFGGGLINCMGAEMENILNRPHSALNRNSDDYFPARRHVEHITQNAYNALLHDEIHICDFDMWWSEHENAAQSSLLRAISGGPVYVSDRVGHSDARYILPLMDEQGEVYRCDNAAKPTTDCVYRDCVKEALPLKLYNRKEDKFVVAAFGLTENATVSGTLSLKELPGARGSYMAQNFFTKEFVLLDENTSVAFSLGMDEIALWNLYPVIDGKVTLGREDKWMGIASEAVKTVAVEELLPKA